MHSQLRLAEAFATARMTAFRPGQSPPPVTTPIRLLMRLLYCLCGEPGDSIFPDQLHAFIHRVYTMRDGEIDFAGKFVAFLQHRATPPLNKFGPHFADENEWRVVQLPDLEQLPRERKLKQSSDTARHNDERIRNNHEMVKSGKKSAVFVRLADKRVHLLFEWQFNTNTDRALESLWVDRMCSFIRRL